MSISVKIHPKVEIIEIDENPDALHIGDATIFLGGGQGQRIYDVLATSRTVSPTKSAAPSAAVIATLRDALSQHRGDDLARARIAFHGADLDAEHGDSGRTRREILEEYERHDQAVSDALSFVDGLAAEPAHSEAP